MDAYQRIQHAVDFIEANLQKECGMTEIAAAACYSPFHFQRMFQAITGFSVQAYCRKRRLSEAARELAETNHSILSVALAYRYGSQEAFTRAFESVFQLTPAKYRKGLMPLKLQGKMDFLAYRNKLNGDLTMNKPELLQLEKTMIAGYRYETTLVNEQYFADIPCFHRDFGEQEHYLRLPDRKAPAISYGISYDFREDGAFSFLVGEEVDERSVGMLKPGFCHLELPAGLYAVFSLASSVEAIQNARRYIYGTWLLASNYERADGPDFEITDVLRSVYPHTLRMKICIPLASPV